jgi:hypothetical protein
MQLKKKNLEFGILRNSYQKPVSLSVVVSERLFVMSSQTDNVGGNNEVINAIPVCSSYD